MLYINRGSRTEPLETTDSKVERSIITFDIQAPKERDAIEGFRGRRG